MARKPAPTGPSKARARDIELLAALRADPERESVQRLINDLSAFAERSGSPARFTLNKLWWLLSGKDPSDG